MSDLYPDVYRVRGIFLRAVVLAGSNPYWLVWNGQPPDLKMCYIFRRAAKRPFGLSPFGSLGMECPGLSQDGLGLPIHSR